MKLEDYIQSTTKTGNQRINCYGVFSKHKKYSLSFFFKRTWTQKYVFNVQRKLFQKLQNLWDQIILFIWIMTQNTFQ